MQKTDFAPSLLLPQTRVHAFGNAAAREKQQERAEATTETYRHGRAHDVNRAHCSNDFSHFVVLSRHQKQKFSTVPAQSLSGRDTPRTRWQTPPITYSNTALNGSSELSLLSKYDSSFVPSAAFTHAWVPVSPVPCPRKPTQQMHDHLTRSTRRSDRPHEPAHHIGQRAPPRTSGMNSKMHSSTLRILHRPVASSGSLSFNTKSCCTKSSKPSPFIFQTFSKQ